MRTLLSQFCESFERVVRPLLDPLNAGAQALSDASSELPGREVRVQLLDLRHQFEGLVDKVAEQQAYVLIFGPLKSGKSTLMNALAASYVSEVSSLPAYPCMVYVSHGDERGFEVTRYDGKSDIYADPAAVQQHITRAHRELVERIREAEESGYDFDPALHYPESIRKIEVRVPARDLDHSGAVLVDTPGLYSRMKFGYDRMTRDFRNSASCAIFIVKSENLFLEQVFEEFEDLLDLFSRIFLVVNIDSNKADLSPDGELIPSLEQEAPLRVVEAFENLSMSAPLKEAADEGRLRIYPVDLLKAASARLKGRAGEETEPVRGQANFDAFLGDLTEYLNSTDYMMAFLGDSLRRATNLLEETTELLEHPAVEELRVKSDALDTERQDAQRRRNAVQRLESFDWKQAFEELDEKLAPTIRECAKRQSEETERAVDGVIDRWFGSDASFQVLVEDELIPKLKSYRDELTRFVRSTLDEEVMPGTAGILLPTDVSADLYAAGVDLSAVGKSCLDEIDKEIAPRAIATPLVTAQVPVRRRMRDWFLFRGQTRIRQRLFGDQARPSLRIPVDVKTSRIGKDGREAIRRELDLYKGRFFHETVQHIHHHIIGVYADAAVGRMSACLLERDAQLEVHVEDVVARLMEHRSVLAHLSTLKGQAERATKAVGELTDEYVTTEPELLIQPAPAPEGQRPSVVPAGPLATEALPNPVHAGTPDGGRDESESHPSSPA